MISAPKSLTDLRRIDAGLRVTCRACGHQNDVDRERLIRDLMARQRSLDWSQLPRAFRCSCGSKDVRLLIMPFGEQDHPPPAELARFIAANEALMAANKLGQANTDALVALSEAALEYQQAKRALVAWAML